MFRSKFFQHKVYSCLTYESQSPPPSEILVPDLDDVDQPAERAAKRRRIEEQGIRYLKGHPLYIASASLKGPFDGNWRNPWKKRMQLVGTEAQGHENLVWQGAANVDAAVVESQPERRGREERRRLRKQRAERAAKLQKDGLGKSPAKPVDLTREDGHDTIPSRPKHLNGHTEDWLRRQQLSRFTPEPPADDLGDLDRHGTTEGELTPSKPPQSLRLRVQGDKGKNMARNVFQRHTVEPEPSPFQVQSLLPQTKSSPVPRLGTRPATKLQSLRSAVDAPAGKRQSKAYSHTLLRKPHNDEVREYDQHRHDTMTELIHGNCESFNAKILPPETSTSPTHGYDVFCEVVDRQIDKARSVHVSRKTQRVARPENLRQSDDSPTVASSALVSASLQVNVSGNSPVRYVEEPTQNDLQQHDPSLVTQTRQCQTASELSRLHRPACKGKVGINVIAGETIIHDQYPLVAQATPSPQKHSSGFTPVNSHFSSPETSRIADITPNGVSEQVSTSFPDGMRRNGLTEFDRAQGSTNDIGGLRNAKLLSQRAIEQALASCHNATAEILHTDSPEDRLSCEGSHIRGMQGRSAQAESDRVSFRTTVQQSAERCAQANGDNGGKKPTRHRTRSGGLAAIKSTGTAQSNGAVAVLDVHHPLNASPNPNSSTGFVYRRGKHNDNHSVSATETGPVTGNTVPQKKKPRLMSFTSPAATAIPPVNKGELNSNGAPQAPLEQEPPVNERSSQDDWRLVEQYANKIIPSHSEGDSGKGNISARLRKVLRKSGASFDTDRQLSGGVQRDSNDLKSGEQQPYSAEPTAQPTSGPHPSTSGGAIPDHQDSTAYLTSNGDFSTQAAISMARNAFQHELISPQKEIVISEPHAFLTPAPPAQTAALTAITPFRDFNSPTRGAQETPNGDLAISTQALFDAASGLAFSTIKKSKGKKRASFAPSPIRERYDAGIDTSPAILPNNIGTSFESTLGPAIGDTIKPVEAHDALHAVPQPQPQPQPQEQSPDTSAKGQANPTPASSGLAFSISSQGPIKAVSYQEGQRLLNDDLDLEAVIDDAGSYLQSWSLDYDPRSSFKGKSVRSSAQSRNR